MQKWPDLVGPHTCIESPSKLLPSGRAEIRKCSGPRAPWGKSCKSICDWPHPQRRPNKSRRTRSALSNSRSGVTYCIPFCWIFTNKYQCKKWGFFTFSQSRLSVVFWRFPGTPVPSATRLTVSLFHCSSGRKRTRRGWGPLKGSQAVSDQKAGKNEREWYSQTVWSKWPDLSSRHADRTSNQCCICWKARRTLKSRAWGKNKAGSFSSFAVSSCDSSSGFRTRRQTSIRYQVQVVTYPFVLSTSFQT